MTRDRRQLEINAGKSKVLVVRKGQRAVEEKVRAHGDCYSELCTSLNSFRKRHPPHPTRGKGV